MRLANDNKTYWDSDQNPNKNTRADGKGGLTIVLGLEKSRVLQCSERCGRTFSGYVEGFGYCMVLSPPTTVSCAPRRIALGSKFDMAAITLDLGFQSVCGGLEVHTDRHTGFCNVKIDYIDIY